MRNLLHLTSMTRSQRCISFRCIRLQRFTSLGFGTGAWHGPQTHHRSPMISQYLPYPFNSFHVMSFISLSFIVISCCSMFLDVWNLLCKRYPRSSKDFQSIPSMSQHHSTKKNQPFWTFYSTLLKWIGNPLAGKQVVHRCAPCLPAQEEEEDRSPAIKGPEWSGHVWTCFRWPT